MAIRFTNSRCNCMGISVEFNPDLNLRNYSEFLEGRRSKEECLPEKIVVGKTYPFLKKDQRLYWLDGELPLRETVGQGKLSRAIASIIIEEVTYIKTNGQTYTKGLYRVTEIFTDDKIHFDGLEKIR